MELNVDMLTVCILVNLYTVLCASLKMQLPETCNERVDLSNPPFSSFFHFSYCCLSTFIYLSSKTINSQQVGTMSHSPLFLHLIPSQLKVI